jgi:GntR family transcriptional regulator
MDALIDIDPASPIPLYLQIAECFRRLIALGALKPGDRLPAVRDLAIRVRVNRNTAARAIQHLEGEGLVRTQVGQGTFVERAPQAVDAARRGALVDDLIDRLITEALTLGEPLEQLGPRLAKRVESLRRRQEEASSKARGPEGVEGGG